MTAEEHQTYVDRVTHGMRLSVERTLRRKAALGEYVVYAHPDGTPYTIPAAEALDRYLSRARQCAE